MERKIYVGAISSLRAVFHNEGRLGCPMCCGRQAWGVCFNSGPRPEATERMTCGKMCILLEFQNLRKMLCYRTYTDLKKL